MSATPYQIIAPLICFVAVAYAWNLVVRQKKTLWEGILWTLFWGAIGVIAVYPDAIDYLTTFTGIKDRENAVVFTFLGILFFVIFYLVMRLEDLEQRQTRIVRKMALKDADLDGDRRSSQ